MTVLAGRRQSGCHMCHVQTLPDWGGGSTENTFCDWWSGFASVALNLTHTTASYCHELNVCWAFGRLWFEMHILGSLSPRSTLPPKLFWGTWTETSLYLSMVFEHFNSLTLFGLHLTTALSVWKQNSLGHYGSLTPSFNHGCCSKASTQQIYNANTSWFCEFLSVFIFLKKEWWQSFCFKKANSWFSHNLRIHALALWALCVPK